MASVTPNSLRTQILCCTFSDSWLRISPRTLASTNGTSSKSSMQRMMSGLKSVILVMTISETSRSSSKPQGAYIPKVQLRLKASCRGDRRGVRLVSITSSSYCSKNQMSCMLQTSGSSRSLLPIVAILGKRASCESRSCVPIVAFQGKRTSCEFPAFVPIVAFWGKGVLYLLNSVWLRVINSRSQGFLRLDNLITDIFGNCFRKWRCSSGLAKFLPLTSCSSRYFSKRRATVKRLRQLGMRNRDTTTMLILAMLMESLRMRFDKAITEYSKTSLTSAGSRASASPMMVFSRQNCQKYYLFLRKISRPFSSRLVVSLELAAMTLLMMLSSLTI